MSSFDDDDPVPITIRDERIDLDQFLKFCGIASSGGEAKYFITEGFISVNGEPEPRRRRKLQDGDRVDAAEFGAFVVLTESPVSDKESDMTSLNDLIQSYRNGPSLLRDAISGMSAEQIDAAPVPGKWSTRQIICHLADFEAVYATRIKRVIATDNPTFFGGFHEQFAQTLAYEQRDLEVELRMIEAVRAHLATILRTLPEETFERPGVHSVYGPMDLRKMVENITNHIPHHVAFIREKRQALGLS